tara:strand:- start:528 stop:1157 length:630 start_codon:yes stop_codon:yes gene_type:complete
METKTLTQFKSKLQGGAARPNLFEVSIPSFPEASAEFWTTGEEGEQGIFTFLCKAAALPASTVANVDIPFRGRNLKVAGDRTIDDWTVTIINDEDFRLRTAFEGWANKMSKLDDATGVTNPTSYMTDAYVKQLGRGATKFATTNDGGESAILRTYKFYDIWPTSIAEIGLNYDNTNQYEEFDVTFKVQFFTVGESDQTTGTQAGETLIR